MINPETAKLIAASVATGAKGGGEYSSAMNSKKAGKIRAKEAKRETEYSLLNDAMQRNAELEAQGLTGTQKINKRRSQASQQMADLVRGAFNI